MRSLFLCLLLLIVPLTTFAHPPRLLFDQGHRQVFTIEQSGPLQLGSLARLMDAEGWRIQVSTAQLTAEILGRVDALIISGAFQPFTLEEIDAIEAFLRGGGRLAIMLHIYQPLVPLLQSLNVAAGEQVIHEQQNLFDGKSSDFFVRDFQPHPLTSGLKEIAVYGGWPLIPLDQQVEEVARCSPEAWVDRDNDQQLTDRDQVSPFAILVSGQVGKGAFAVFGDDAIFQNQFIGGSNLELAKNLARWLKARLLPHTAKAGNPPT